MSDPRFEKLELGHGEGPTPKTPPGQTALLRFTCLEIGELTSPALSPQASPQTSIRSSHGLLINTATHEVHKFFECPHCGMRNGFDRELCWACYRSLKGAPASLPMSDAHLSVVMDGRTYNANEPDLPPDIRTLMDQIRQEGYSRELLVEWRDWRATRMSGPRPLQTPSSSDANRQDPTIVSESRTTVIRLDGHVFTSDDPNLPPEIRQLMDRVHREGVTPELMEELRRHGEKVKYRPQHSPDPTDGDLDFWREVHERLPGRLPGERREGVQSETMLEFRLGELRWQLTRQLFRFLIAGVILLLYLAYSCRLRAL